MLFSELNLAGMLNEDDSAFGPETTRGEIPEALFWSTFCELLERIEPQGTETLGNAEPFRREEPR
jgi:hypothetical protein